MNMAPNQLSKCRVEWLLLNVLLWLKKNPIGTNLHLLPNLNWADYQIDTCDYVVEVKEIFRTDHQHLFSENNFLPF